MGGFAGYLGDFLVTSPPSVAISSPLAYTDSGDHQNYTINDQTKRYLDRSASFTVQTSPDGVTWTTVTNYTLRHVGGLITFTTPNASGTQVRLSAGNYFPYASIGYATDTSFSGQRQMADVTVLQGASGDGWKRFLPLILSGTVTAKKFYIDATFTQHLSNNDLLIVSCVEPTGTNRYEGYCYVKDSSLANKINAVNEESLTFELTGAFYGV